MKNVVAPSDPLPPALVSRSPARPLPWHFYKTTMTSPAGWSSFVRTVRSTRDPELGLRVGFRLLTAAEAHRRRMPQETYQHHLRLLYVFVLGMLDKGDRWVDYLGTWHSIREHTSLYMTYDPDALEDHGPAMEPFVIRRDPGTLHVHFLYGQEHRRAMIERKLARRLAGKSVGHLMHRNGRT